MNALATVLALLLAALLGSGCAAPADSASSPTTFLADQRFAPPSERVDPADVFAVSPAMKEYLAVKAADKLRLMGGQKGLVDALYSSGELKLDYDSATTRNAAQAFEARSGNCLSLVIMTAAFAKELQLGVYYQSVFTDETWARSGDIQFVIDHVNLSIGKRVSEIDRGARFQSVLTVDFLPPSETGKQRARILAENTVVAMYFNNRAAESLAQGAVNDAYWWAREAILQDPSLARGYNTLGVVYRRHGDPKLALNALAHAHALEPDNPQVLSNLAQANIDQGRNAEAAVLLQRLAQIEAEPPFVYFDRGQEALRQGDVVTANAFFERQVDRAPYYHEFHYWLAITQARLGHPRQARKHLEMAMDTSTTRRDHDIYAGKLARLQERLAQ
ncbi:MAG: tetratricopeptide repeat protein [Piscinibacter sp.]|nr:tetratricopeptide repeat protein [Piscinibacter sp.]